MGMQSAIIPILYRRFELPNVETQNENKVKANKEMPALFRLINNIAGAAGNNNKKYPIPPSDHSQCLPE